MSDDPSTPFGAPPDGAEVLAVEGGHQYLRCDWVYRRGIGEQPSYYAPWSAWPTTPAYQLASRDQAIAERDAQIVALRAHVAELELRLAEQKQMAPAATPPAPRARARRSAVRTEALTEAKEEHPCPDCDHDPFPSARALLTHRISKHGYRNPPAAPPPDLPVAEPPATLVLQPSYGWPCAGCNVEKAPGDFALPDGTISRYCPECRENRRRAREALDKQQQIGDRPWSCAACGRSREVVTQSLRDETLCMQCAASRPIAASNGHLAPV